MGGEEFLKIAIKHRYNQEGKDPGISSAILTYRDFFKDLQTWLVMNYFMGSS